MVRICASTAGDTGLIPSGRTKGFPPDSSGGKESTCNAGDPSSIPGSGRSTREGRGSPLQCSWASLVAHTELRLLHATRLKRKQSSSGAEQLRFHLAVQADRTGQTPVLSLVQEGSTRGRAAEPVHNC